VLAGQLLALLQGEAEAQAQSVNNTPDRTVSSYFAGPRVSASLPSVTVTSSPDGTDLIVSRTGAADVDGGSAPDLTIRVMRVLRPIQEEPQSPGYVTAIWRAPDGIEVRGLFAEVRA
jgi:hypothetical protein